MLTQIDIVDQLDELDEEQCRALVILMEIPIDERGEKQPQFSYKALLAREMFFKQMQEIRNKHGDHSKT